MIKAVLFDFDGVLVDTYKYHLLAWRHFLAGYGVTVEAQKVFLNEGLPVQEIAENLAKDFSLNLSKAELMELAQKKNQYFRENNRAQFLDGMPEFITKLKSRGIKVAMVTGTVEKNIHGCFPVQTSLFLMPL